MLPCSRCMSDVKNSLLLMSFVMCISFMILGCFNFVGAPILKASECLVQVVGNVLADFRGAPVRVFLAQPAVLVQIRPHAWSAYGDHASVPQYRYHVGGCVFRQLGHDGAVCEIWFVCEPLYVHGRHHKFGGGHSECEYGRLIHIRQRVVPEIRRERELEVLNEYTFHCSAPFSPRSPSAPPLFR